MDSRHLDILLTGILCSLLLEIYLSGIWVDCHGRPDLERSTKKRILITDCSYAGCKTAGLCCEYLHYYRKNGQLPACYFTDDAEKTYDRSIAHFIKNNS